MRLPALLSVLALTAFSAGCGPIFSTYLIIDAESKMSAAKAAEADRYAIYEYTASEAYLAKAHEELGYADYGPAIDYAYKAADLAAQGTTKATEERHKLVDEPTAPTVSSEETVEPEPTAAPKKVIIKKITVPGVPSSDPSSKSGPRS
ncbi:MAG: DUF4398 domain-containing protein [Deltaproteobacteria bacterium]|nr:DUF4398 domain-containing protein [Deltaproteobacteria bacterium]